LNRIAAGFTRPAERGQSQSNPDWKTGRALRDLFVVDCARSAD
jgi:hypothetical protein